MTALVILAAAWAAGLFFALALGCAASAADRHAERVATRLRVPPELPARTPGSYEVVARWWDSGSAYTVKI